MASTELVKLEDEMLSQLTKLLWGNTVKEDVFERWSQGFVFSKDEPSALLQLEGGPCAVIVPVQAYVLKNLIFSDQHIQDLTTLTKEECCRSLCQAMVDIMLLLKTSYYYIVKFITPSTSDGGTSQCNNDNSEDGERDSKRRKIDRETFHSRLRYLRCESESEMKEAVSSSLTDYQNKYGVLCFMYSLILSRGIDQVKNEVEDPSEPLIDGVHGHGSQSLINLLLSGRALSNVFDNDKDVCGLVLRGIQQQSVIGFLTLLEQMRYCEVGWYLKNPQVPIWVLASETHLTILFTKETGLVDKDSPLKNAQQIFNSYDPEGNGFIRTDQLGELMETLNLFCDKEYVDIMKKKLDDESLGIITCNGFMEEFYAEELKSTDVPRQFELYHYNGLARSCPAGKVKYIKGMASLPDEIELQLISDTSPIKLCLQTKWPSIELKWEMESIPSLN